ncbi:WD repeat domain-containing protein, partial [Tetrabaena socialis]
AFIKLESMPSIPNDKRDSFADLAMSIFLKHQPADPRALRETREKKAPGGAVSTLDALLEDLGGGRDQVCVASGRIVRDGNVVRCKVCKHLSIIHELRGSAVCPLCHGVLQLPAAGPGGGAGGRGVTSAKSQMSQMYGGGY